MVDWRSGPPIEPWRIWTQYGIHGMTTPPSRLATLVSLVLPVRREAVHYAAVAVAVAVYLASYTVIEVFGAIGASIMAIVPAGAVAWYFGARAGVVAAVLAFPANLGLEVLNSDRGVVEWLQDGAIIGHAALLGTALIIGLLRDMTAKVRRELEARKRIESELRNSEDRYRFLYANTPVMMHSVDADFRLLSLNRRWADTMGYEPEEVIGRDVTELLTEESRRYALDVARPETVRTGVLKDAPFRMVKKSGEVIDVLLSGVAISDRNGELTHTLAFLIDVTESNRAERERRDLEMKALSQSKLATLGEVATGVAHEINQPLTYISTTVQSLLEDFELDDVDAESAQGRLTESHRQVDRITAIVDHLRTFGRANETEMAPLQIEAVLDNSLTLLGERIKGLGIDLRRAAAPGVPEIMGNSSQLEQVFINLFKNSIDALADTKSGAFIAVSIRTPSDHSQAEVVFSDNGVGISQQDADRVFEPFFTTKEPGKGTGLGLSIAYSIVMEHGGSIACDSDQDGGTTITFSIPAAVAV